MAVKRGVSLYSYQQTYMKGLLDLEGCIRTVVETTGARGIELIYEQMPVERYPVAVYPHITDRGVAQWKEWMAKYGTVPTCMDSFIDSKIYGCRLLTVAEQVQRMEQDLRLAAKLGFDNIRVLAIVPPEVIERSIPIAEHYGVKMGQEIHSPLHIQDRWVQTIAEMARKHDTKFLGLTPDFGIFQKGVPGSALKLCTVYGENRDLIDRLTADIRADVPMAAVLETAKSLGASDRTIGILTRWQFMTRYNDPELLRGIADVIVHFHGKFNLVENGDELTINYKDPIRILKELGWDGYISSEFEGQRMYHATDCPYEEDEIEQVRRHHEMLKEYIGA